MGGGGYILSKTIAARLLKATKEFGAPVDYVLFSPEHMIFPQVSRLQMYPAICVQQVRNKTVFLPENAEISEDKKNPLYPTMEDTSDAEILVKKKNSFRRLNTSDGGREYFQNVQSPDETTWVLPNDATIVQ